MGKIAVKDSSMYESFERLKDKNGSVESSLLDAQSEKIKDFDVRLLKSESDYMDKVHLVRVRGREINRLNKVIHEKNELIRNLVSERGKVARELSAERALHQVDLQATKSSESALLYHEREYEKSLSEKDDVIDALSDELACSRKREEELIETVQDYQKQLDELRKLQCSSVKSNVRNRSKKRKKRGPVSNKGIHVVVDDVEIPNDMYELLYFIFG